MRTVLLLLIFCCNICFAQTETWKLQNYCIGENTGGFSGVTAGTIPTMAEAIELPDGTFRMYFNAQLNYGEKHCISYAESLDAIDWSYADTCFCGSSDTLARNFIIGGPSIVKLTNGQYRMYYRTTQKFTTTPQYHVRSAISTDGVNFTQEAGIRIDIQPFNSSSSLLLAGHGSYWQLDNGTFAGIFSGNPDTSTLISPSHFIHATSADGLTWTNFKVLYLKYHDPIVVKKNNQYILYGMNLASYMIKAVSTDGLNWPASADSVSFLDTTNTPMLINNTKRIGDVGGIVMPNNDIYLYTNYSGTSPTGPSKDIIRFSLLNPSASVTANDSTTFCQGESVTLLANTGSGYTYQWLKDASTITGATNASYVANISGNYSVVVTNSDGYSTESTETQVTVNLNPPIPTIAQNGNTLSCSTSGMSYQWIMGTSNISGATSQTYSPSQNGNYSVQITNSNGCKATSNSFNFTLSGLENNFSTNKNQVELFPNPFNSSTILKIHNFNEQSDYVLKIYDLPGREARGMKLTSSQTIIERGDLSEGVYHFELSENGQIKAEGKLVVIE